MVLKAKAFAKLNLMLAVTGKLPNGYHNIQSVMQSVSLHDTVKINITDNNIITVKTNDPELNLEQNIAQKSAELYFKTANLKNGAEIFINKNIPKAAGLGGGSADAATVLLLLNKKFGAFGEKELSKIALTLGADVPFCLTGGTAAVEGIGEKLNKINNIPACYIVLVKNFSKNSTKEMYNKIDLLGFAKCNQYGNMLNAVENFDLNGICNNIYNDFYNVSKNKQTQNLFNTFKQYNPLGYGLSGSGPTVFAVFSNNQNAYNLFDFLNSKVEFVTVCEPVNKSFEIID